MKRPSALRPPRVAEAEARSGGYGWFALVVLLLAYVLAFVDRQVLNLLVQPIKRDLGLSDVQISLLQGLSFALFLSIGGLPIGRLIDTRRRTRLLGAAIAVWSLASASCGLAVGYGQLLLGRIGVGIGEAAMTPSAYSLIGDYFPPRRQGLAISLYSVGAYVGAGLALVVGAAVTARVPAGTTDLPILGAVRGWQIVFLLVGMPGVAVAALVACLREPVRAGGVGAAPPRREVIAWFRQRARPLVLVNLSVALAALAMYGLMAWLPTFFLRQHGVPAASAGHSLGLIVMFAGAGGTLAAGLLGDRQERRGQRDGRIRVMLAGAALAIPFVAMAPLVETPSTAFLLIAPALFFLTLAIGSGPATLQQMTPPRMRGLQHACAVLAVNLIGLGCGPTLVAFVTDHLLHDESRIGIALAATLPAALAASVAFGLLALAPYRRAIASADVA